MRLFYFIWHWINPNSCIIWGGSTQDAKIVEQSDDSKTIECRCGKRIRAVRKEE